MSSFKNAWNAIRPKFLGGDPERTLGSVRGVAASGTTADFMKATGEIRVHAVRAKGGEELVTVELPQQDVPGDSAEMICVRLDRSEALRLAAFLGEAAGA